MKDRDAWGAIAAPAPTASENQDRDPQEVRNQLHDSREAPV
jgi:hypothetical protein